VSISLKVYILQFIEWSRMHPILDSPSPTFSLYSFWFALESGKKNNNNILQIFWSAKFFYRSMNYIVLAILWLIFSCALADQEPLSMNGIIAGHNIERSSVNPPSYPEIPLIEWSIEAQNVSFCY